MLQANLFADLFQPLVLAYGMGVDSTAVIVRLVKLGIRPHVILFANTGGEKWQTYAYLPIINAYLTAHGFPTVTVVRYIPQNFKNWPPYYTLEQNCLTNGTLPSISFSFQFKSCSQKWKAAPQHKWLQNWEPAKLWWAAGGRVKKIIGYDAGAKDRKRMTYACNSEVEDEHYEYWYPLTEWGLDRTACEEEIRGAGLPVPPKSSCFFCAAMHTEEVDALEPMYLAAIVRMEARARPRFTSIKGLWGKGSKKKSGSMTDYIRAKGLLPPEVIDHIIDTTPGDIIDYQEAFTAGMDVQPFGEFIHNQLIQIEGVDTCNTPTM